jgi:hypothetical protein
MIQSMPPKSELDWQKEFLLSPYGIHLGVPLCTPPESCAIYVPDEPHVFLCSKLIIIPMMHFPLLPKATVTLEDRTWGLVQETGIELENVMVTLGHALVVGSREEDWVFRGTKQPVSATVAAYERFAQSTGNPLLDVIIACNDDTTHTRVTFARRDIPYVYPSGSVHLISAIGSSTRTLIPGRGAVLLAKADKWNSLDRWNIYRLSHPRRESFPGWTIQPAS